VVHQVKRCRICGNPTLVSILDLGQQVLTGVFPASAKTPVGRAPLELVKCFGPEACGLVQLRHTYDLTEMYGDNYGYRSSLNPAMVTHLREVQQELVALAPPRKGDVVVDIGSNDGTLLGFYPAGEADLVGIDPTARKFAAYYKPHVRLITDFFSAARFRTQFADRKARIVTSIAMFYDLEQPQDFVNDVAAVLADDGLWHFEQSYLPGMIAANAYDTACHEHLEYYALRQVKFMLDRAGLVILKVAFNDVNGGSFAVTAAKAGGPYKPDTAGVEAILRSEEEGGFNTMKPFEAFKRRVFAHRDELVALLTKLKASGQTVFGYGASTKGNVVLQFCGITTELLPCIAEVNGDKFGRVTPGTHIPIISETEARSRKPAFFLVLPWHFKRGILARETEYLKQGGKFIFPLPRIEVVG
jgi:hypothetical protein